MRIDTSIIEAWKERIAAARGPLVSAQSGNGGESAPNRIAILGWARLSLQAREGSGLNLSVSELAAELANRGNLVAYLRSGMDYSVRPGMRISLQEIWRGVGCFSLINSPNVAPANFNFHNIGAQMSHAAEEAIVVEWARVIKPDVIHIHSLEGFSFGCVQALRSAGFAVVITPHNYYSLCPQVDLLHREQRICEDYGGGEKCPGCLSHAPDVKKYIGWRKRYQSAERLLGPHALTVVKERAALLREGLGHKLNGKTPPVVESLKPALPRPPVLPASPDDENERIFAANRKLVVLNKHGERRAAGIAALNRANAILAPSRFLMRVHELHGVEGGLLRHVPLGQPHFDAILAASKASPYYEQSPWNPSSPRPVRFAYFGNCFPNKGLSTLCLAIEQLPEAIARHTHFVIRASGDDEPFRQWMAGRANVSFLGSYDLRQLLSSAGGYDVCIFPNMGLENSPFVVLEALHAGKFLIASNLGGPTDWVVPPRNGLLFAAGDTAALNAAIASVVKGVVRLPSPKEVQAASHLRSFASYVDDVVAEYAQAAKITRR